MDLTSLFDIGSRIIDKVIPDPTAKAQAQLELMKLEQSGELAQLNADTTLAQGQLDTNKVEAANTNLFVSGWRPFIGWVCGSGLLYQFICAPLLTWIASLLGHPITMPELDLSTLLTLLLGMLGLGGLRSYEKVKGVATK